MGADGGFELMTGAKGKTSCMAAGQIAEMLTGRSLLTTPMLERVMAGVFGAPASTGAWSIRDAFDVLEAGAVLAAARLPQADAAETLTRLQDFEKRLPTQARRSEEQMLLQQFSTPLPYAHLAALAAQIGPADLVLEPSASPSSPSAPGRGSSSTKSPPPAARFWRWPWANRRSASTPDASTTFWTGARFPPWWS